MINTLNPILLQFGPLTIRWYGLLLAIGVGLSVLIIAKLFKQKNYPVNLAFDLCTWLIIGGLIGARLGEILFYEPAYYFSHPLEMIMINHGGLSSHGMTIGLLLTLIIFSKIKKISIKQYLDILIIPIPLLATFIRLGNFFNSEIVGRATNLPWGVYFPNYETNPILRHPSQIYEALICLSLFIILYFFYKKYYTVMLNETTLSEARGSEIEAPPALTHKQGDPSTPLRYAQDDAKLPPLFIFHLFLLLYFSSRFVVEFVKEYPLYFGLTTGQWLSIPFIIWSVYCLINSKIKRFKDQKIIL